jgi:hypothetical protein
MNETLNDYEKLKNNNMEIQREGVQLTLIFKYKEALQKTKIIASNKYEAMKKAIEISKSYHLFFIGGSFKPTYLQQNSNFGLLLSATDDDIIITKEELDVINRR